MAVTGPVLTHSLGLPRDKARLIRCWVCPRLYTHTQFGHQQKQALRTFRSRQMGHGKPQGSSRVCHQTSVHEVLLSSPNGATSATMNLYVQWITSETTFGSVEVWGTFTDEAQA